MNLINSIELQYQGYKNTPELWKGNPLFDIEQFNILPQDQHTFKGTFPDNLLLGKRVEQFVIGELEHVPTIEILLTNRQIQNGKTTVGEIDCLLKQDGIPIHLEIVYKFYLYDTSLGTSEIEHWIGPNRNDTLQKKLNKLKEKQFPLLYNKHTQPILDNLELEADNVEQRVRFKAQLFTPYQATLEIKQLNDQCLSGFYVYQSQIEQFSFCMFYIPNKVDWLQDPQLKVHWETYEVFKKKVSILMQEKKAPLCWIQFPNGVLQKFFVVWWPKKN